MLEGQGKSLCQASCVGIQVSCRLRPIDSSYARTRTVALVASLENIRRPAGASMTKTQETKKRGLSPRSFASNEERLAVLESMDGPRKSPAAAFVRAALLETVPNQLEDCNNVQPTMEDSKSTDHAPQRTLVRVP